MATIRRDPADPIAGSAPVTWAVGQLEAALGAVAGATAEAPRIVVGGPGSAEARVLLARAGLTLPDAPESLAVAHVEGTTVAAGAAGRGHRRGTRAIRPKRGTGDQAATGAGSARRA